jgi:sugar lactone lactonase YvrE
MVDPHSIVVKRALILLTMVATGCQQVVISPSPSPTVTAGALRPCPLGAPALAGPEVLRSNLAAPDDLAFDNDGRLLFSDINAGTVSALGMDGSLERIAGGLNVPEGIVVLGSGQILVAEQGRNRIVAIDPASHAVSPWRAFANRTGQEGIDGIGPELSSVASAPGGVIVPDSPNGVVWRVSFDGKTATQIGGGMTRPVGAAVDHDGRIFVADEGGALWTLDPVRRRFATLATPDDVAVARGGHIFVNTLGDNAIHEFDAQGHQVTMISGISQPQGIALDDADNLYYTESGRGRIGRVVRSFILDPPSVTRTTRGTFIICPVVRRAAGFLKPLTLLAPSPPAATLQLIQPGADASGALEVQTPKMSITITVSDGGLLSLSQTVTLSP